MVKNTGAQTGPGALRSLNLPSDVQVEVEGNSPVRVVLRGQWLVIDEVADRWLIDDEWWREQPISRMYFECLLADGRRVILFYDLVSDRWHHQSHA